MANTDAPHGLRPLGVTLEGGCPTVMEYNKDANEGAAIFIWDLVNVETDGNIEANSASPGTTRFLGVALNHGALSTLTAHLVVVSPSALFEAQAKGATGLAAADMGLNANAILDAGNTDTLVSKHGINDSTEADTASLDLRLIGLHNVSGNAFGVNARIEVFINKHIFNKEVTGV